MSVKTFGRSSHSENRPVAPPRRCRNKDSSSSSSSSSLTLSQSANDIEPPPSDLSAWLSSHPRRVNRTISETPATWLGSNNNHSCNVKTISLERTRVKGLPPSPIVHQPARKNRITTTTAPRTTTTARRTATTTSRPNATTQRTTIKTSTKVITTPALKPPAAAPSGKITSTARRALPTTPKEVSVTTAAITPATSSTTAPRTVPKLPAKKSVRSSVEKLPDLKTEQIPDLPVKTIPRLPPKEKKEKSNLSSGILNSQERKETGRNNSRKGNNERISSVYEDVKSCGPEVIKVTQNKITESKDINSFRSSLQKKLTVDAKMESFLSKPSLVNDLNTQPKQSPNKQLLPAPSNRGLPARTGVLPIPRRSDRIQRQTEPKCFTTPSSKFFDMSNINREPPSLISATCNEGINSIKKSQMTSVSKLLLDGTNDISLLSDDSFEPDFGHLILLQGGVDAIQAALQARKEKRFSRKRGGFSTEKSQLAVETDSTVDDAGYEVPAADEKNSPIDSDPTYEEVTFRYPEGKDNSQRSARWCSSPRTFFSTLASVFRSRCCLCKCRLKASSYRFTKGSTWDWHPSEIPQTTKGSRSSEFVARVRTKRRPSYQ